MNNSAEYFIKSLNMTAHPEGGYFKNPLFHLANLLQILYI